MRVITSLSKKFQQQCDIHSCNEEQLNKILPYWFEKIDDIYFSNSNDSIEIKLDDYDKQLILKSRDCFDKLKSLSFKKNITIVNFTWFLSIY